MIARRTALLSTALLFAAFVAWRLLWFSYDPSHLYRALPPSATFISEHDALSERWTELLTHPAATVIGSMVGVTEGDLKEVVEEEGTQWVLDRFAGRKTLVAFSPALGRKGQAAWMLVSWGGIHCQLARWGLYAPFVEDLERRRLPNGRTGWTLKMKTDVPGGMQLSLASAQGMLFACYSRDPDAVVALVDRMEHGADMPAYRRLQGGQGPRDAHDRCWIQTREAFDVRTTAGWQLALDVEPAHGGLMAWAGGNLVPLLEGRRFEHVGEALGPVAEELAGLIGPVPAGMVLVPFSYVDEVLEMARGSNAEVLVRECLDAYDPGITHVVTSVASLDYGGSLLGIRTPSVIVGLRASAVPDAGKMLAAWLDRINAREQIGLIGKRQHGERALYELDAVRLEVFNRLGGREKPAVLVVGQWVFVASNRKLLEGIPYAGSDGAETPRWLSSAAADTTHALAWIDVAALTDVYINFLGIYDILTFRPFRKPTPLRQDLAFVRQCLESARGLGDVRLHMQTDGDDAQLSLALGSE